MNDFVPTHIETRFRPGSDREHVTNTQGPVIVHAIQIRVTLPTYALVEYPRYNGSGSPLGLWTQVLEVVPISELWEVVHPLAKAEV